MAEIVNLRRVRKQAARSEREKVAAENRQFFGRTRAARDADRKTSERSAAALDGHRRDTAREAD